MGLPPRLAGYFKYDSYLERANEVRRMITDVGKASSGLQPVHALLIRRIPPEHLKMTSVSVFHIFRLFFKRIVQRDPGIQIV